MTVKVAAPERASRPRLFAAPASLHVDRGDRIASIDALRGFTILLMIFVNDVAGVQGVPAWMKHIEPPDADGMTFVDVVFPAFLFIVGMSIPFAIGRRLERKESLAHVWRHILTRTLSLLVIGVFMVNTEVMSDAGVLSPPLWTLLMYVGVILVWCTPTRGLWGQKTVTGLRVAGVALLSVLAVLYRGTGPPSLIELRPYWWGILGLIGWAYLVACAAYLLFRNRTSGLIGAMVLLYCVYIADAAGSFSGLTWVTDWVGIGSMLGSQAALTVSGVVLGTMLLPGTPAQTHAARMRWALLYGLALAAAGHLLHAARDVHQMFIINKIFATPPWCLWSAALTVWVWVVIYWLLDVRRWTPWSAMLERSGQNALLAYILAPILYAAFALAAAALAAPNVYVALGDRFATGLWRAVLFALAVVWISAGLRRVGFQLRL